MLGWGLWQAGFRCISQLFLHNKLLPAQELGTATGYHLVCVVRSLGVAKPGSQSRQGVSQSALFPGAQGRLRTHVAVS